MNYGKAISGNLQIFSAHHASSDFDHYSDRRAVTPEEQIRFSDYGKDIASPITYTFIILNYINRV